MVYLACMVHRRHLGDSRLGGQGSLGTAILGMGPFLPSFLLSLLLFPAPNTVSLAPSS